MTTYRTSSGDMVDEIAFKHYGTTAGRIVEQILDANPGLADAGPVLPAGIDITLPIINTASTNKGIKLWD